jgi:hypothetical protein
MRQILTVDSHFIEVVSSRPLCLNEKHYNEQPTCCNAETVDCLMLSFLKSRYGFSVHSIHSKAFQVVSFQGFGMNLLSAVAFLGGGDD